MRVSCLFSWPRLRPISVMLAASNRKDQDFAQLKEKNVWGALLCPLYVFNNGEKHNRVSLHCQTLSSSLPHVRDTCNNIPQGSEAKYDFAL